MDGASTFEVSPYGDVDASKVLDELKTGKFQLTDQIIMALCSAIEAKDHYTNGHSMRVAQYAMELARRLGWDEEHCIRAYYAGILHDVGKISIRDSILNNEGKLTEGEYESVKLHPLIGYYILKGISNVSDFAIGARWHHERYDGSGYPNGLAGENIPLISRVISVADAYDSMTSYRSYRDVLSQEKVRNEIEAGLGTQFDPEIGKLMLEMIDEDVDYRMRQPEARSEYLILAIDDDPMGLKLLDFVLGKDKRYKMIAAHSGEEGIELLGESKFDLILLDLEMPGMNGFDVLQWIRDAGIETPVIFMTGEKGMGNILKAEAMGVSDYLTKPLVPDMLHESIKNVLFSSIREMMFAAPWASENGGDQDE